MATTPQNKTARIISDNNLLPVERDIMQRVAKLPINFQAMAVISNIWRTSQAIKLQFERDVLREYDLTWGSFSTLFVIWVWGPAEIRHIAAQQGVSRATVSSNISQLARRGLCKRLNLKHDKRLTSVELTARGRRWIEYLFPRFNQRETNAASSLTTEEQQTLAKLLRKVYLGMQNGQ
jgi:DNA-binding MarR family transcriptional regulator